MSGLPDLNDAAAVASWNRAAIGFLRETLDKIMVSVLPSFLPEEIYVMGWQEEHAADREFLDGDDRIQRPSGKAQFRKASGRH
jgi:hypothetical protein